MRNLVAMQNALAVEETVVREHHVEAAPSAWRVLLPWIAGMLIVVAVGSWLVWFSAHVQRTFAEEDIRKACLHVMPETADRCFDTVVIQRGGVRR